jgi:hypothetical protein
MYMAANGVLAILMAALVGLGVEYGWAQAAAPSNPAVDSLTLDQEARAAQREFEQTRRAHLPPDLGGPRRSCDERIGRYCYWYDPPADHEAQEPDVIVQARGRLLRDLGAALDRLPGDEWISGQLVRYLTEQQLADSAVTIVRQCHATRWWCDALEGFAHHAARDFGAADSSFAQALAAMPPGQRCAWSDLSLILGEEGRSYRATPCSMRDSIEQVVWWLARPLYSRPGNDLRTEHYARHTMAVLLRDAATPDGYRWGADREQLVIRYGWPIHWSRGVNRPGQADPPPVLGHEASPSFWFLPAPLFPEPWEDVTGMQWQPELTHPPARYAPSYATGFDDIERVQFARFQRGDSSLTIAVYDLSPDSVLGSHAADVRLALGKDPHTPILVGADAVGRTPAGAGRS